jgi:hypothetical protein
MKTFILTMLILIFTVLSAQASPFLVCDPQEGVETYNIWQDGTVLATNVPSQPDGSLRFDLDGIVPGTYTFTVDACTESWGCSEVSNPYLSPAPARQPTGLSLTR